MPRKHEALFRVFVALVFDCKNILPAYQENASFDVIRPQSIFNLFKFDKTEWYGQKILYPANFIRWFFNQRFLLANSGKKFAGIGFCCKQSLWYWQQALAGNTCLCRLRMDQMEPAFIGRCHTSNHLYSYLYMGND